MHGDTVPNDTDAYDVDLLIAMRDGDKSAFALLYRRHAVIVLRFAWNRLGERTAAEDLTQETFTLAWTKRMSATILSDSLLPWILAIANNLARNELRKLARHRPSRFEIPDMPAPVRSHEELAWMQVELNKLARTDQALIRLCLVDGLTFKQAAELVDSTESAVSKRIQRARARLQVALGSDE